MDDADRYAVLYDAPIEAGRSVAWRTAISSRISEGLVTQAESDAQEVKVLSQMKTAPLPDPLIDVVVRVAIGNPPADAETREKWQRETMRRVQADHGERKTELLKGVDSFLAAHPEVRKLLQSTGALYEPRVATALVEHVRKITDQRKLRKVMAAKA